MSDDSNLAFVGTYTDGESEGVYGVRADESTGELTVLGATDAGENPSFLALHPDGEFLYAVNEAEGGSVTALSIDRETGELTRLNRQTSGASGPCHCSVDATGSYVMVAHYGGKSVSMLPIRGDGRVGEPSDVVEHEGSSVDPERQTQPRPHSIVPGPENRYAYAPDLGADRVFVYEMDLDEGRLRPTDQGSVAVQDRAGPRHLDFHPDGDVLYLLNEMDSTITTFDRDPETGALDEIETTTTLPAGFDGDNWTAEILVHPSGRWAYASNRGHDSIAVFEIDAESRTPRLVEHESTRGEWPRNFALDPAGAHLFAENQNTNEIVVFRIDEDGTLTATGHATDLPQPVCMKFRSGE